MTVLAQDVRDYLTDKLTPGALNDPTIEKQIIVAKLFVDNIKSDALTDANYDTVVMVCAGYLSYRAYALELETAGGDVPQSTWIQMNTLKEICQQAQEIAAKSDGSDVAGIEGLTGAQRSELHLDRIAGSLPTDEDI
jgi:hypothetical protein